MTNPLQHLPQITISQIDAALARLNWIEDRLKARTDLYFLLTDILGRADAKKPWLEARCREVQEHPNDYLDLWAREHFKSSIITFAKTVQDILRSHGDDPIEEIEVTVGIFSHTRPIAKGFLRQIKYEFESNDRLRALFPDILWEHPQREAPKWSEDDGIIVKRRGNPKESTVEAWGVVDGQPIGKHFRLMVYDDVVTPAAVTTPEMMEKVLEQLKLSFNLGTEGGAKRFIGTRYHFSDAYKYIIDQGVAKPRIYPATVDGTMGGEPVLLGAEYLAQKRRDQGPYVFSSQMLLNPKADETQGFQRVWVKPRHDGVKHEKTNNYIMFDPASGKKKNNDYTCGWCVGLGEDKNIYIHNVVRDRLNLSQRTDLVFDWHRKYKPKQTRYEKYGMQADIEHIQSKQKDEIYRFEVTEVGGQTPKNDRIKRLIPYFEQGRIILPKTLYYTGYDGKTVDLVEVFIEQEFMGFPVPVHDDMLDSLARLLEPDLTLIWPKKKSNNSSSRTRGGQSLEDL